MKSQLPERENEVWLQIAPNLDAAIARLNAKDRHAIILRFFQNKTLQEIGAALGATEDAAKKRVHRGLEKLRLFLTERGNVSPTAVISEAIATYSVQESPATLAKTATSVALAKGTTAGGLTSTLVKGGLKIIAWAKVKTAIGIGAAMAVVGGITLHELKPLEAGWMCGGLLLCLVLPFMMKGYVPQEKVTRKSCLRVVWTGQMILAFGGLVLRFSEAAGVYAMALSALSYLFCAMLLRRKIRDARRTVQFA
jgi:hypothetical protein